MTDISTGISTDISTDISPEIIRQCVKEYGINCFNPYIYFERGMINEFDQHVNSSKLALEIIEYIYNCYNLPFFDGDGHEPTRRRERREREIMEVITKRMVKFGPFDERLPFQLCYKKYNYEQFVSFAINFISKSTIAVPSAGLQFAMTPLMYTCSYCMFDVALQLLATNEKNLRVDLTDENGHTALMHLFFGLQWRISYIDNTINWDRLNDKKECLFDSICLSLLATGKSRPDLMTPPPSLFNRINKERQTAFTLAIEVRKFGLAEAIYKQIAWEKRREFVIGLSEGQGVEEEAWRPPLLS